MSAEKDIKILVVDEFSVTRTIVINHLSKLGFSNTFVAEDGFSALIRLKSSLFVLRITSEDLHGNIINAFKAGLNDYIVRPFGEHIFKQKLEKIFV